MKNLPLILNGILIAAVAFLFTKVYSKNGSTSNKINTSTKDSSGMGTSCKIAYVELDSLNEQILFIKNKKTELEGEQQAIENEFREGYKRLQNISADFQKRAQTEGAAVTQKEAEEMQNRLMQEQQQLTNVKETKSQQLSEKSYKFLEDIQKKLKEFLLTYNKDKKYQYILTTGGGTEYMLYKDESLNITDLVVKEMNLILSK
jgi:outer membrane protein